MTGPEVVGVDFSGRERPGEAIWITRAVAGDDLVVETCRSAREALGERERTAVLAALVEHVADADVVGFDFPFGLPRAVVEDLDGPGEWRATLDWLERAFDDAESFARRCKAAARDRTDGERTYLRRATDEPVGAKSPYHFFTYKQAYHRTTSVLAPLLDRGSGVAPMTDSTEGATTVAEVYPAGTLRRLGLPDENYKAATDAARTTRAKVLDGLEETGGLRVQVDEPERAAALGDADGDALDSLLAAVAAARALEGEFAVERRRYDPLEGYVYV